MNYLALGPSWMDPHQLIATFGLIGLAVVIFAESGILIGFFLPGDSLLFTAGLLVTQGTLKQPLALVCVLVAVAAVLGDQVGFLFGRKVGPSLFSRPDSRLFKQENVEKAHAFFEKHGPKSLILARFVPVVRTFTPIIAGVSRMEYRPFLVYNAVGGTVWAVGVTVLGSVLGRVALVRDHIELMLVAIVLISLVPIVIEYLRQRGKQPAPVASDMSARGEGADQPLTSTMPMPVVEEPAGDAVPAGSVAARQQQAPQRPQGQRPHPQQAGPYAAAPQQQAGVPAQGQPASYPQQVQPQQAAYGQPQQTPYPAQQTPYPAQGGQGAYPQGAQAGYPQGAYPQPQQAAPGSYPGYPQAPGQQQGYPQQAGQGYGQPQQQGYSGHAPQQPQQGYGYQDAQGRPYYAPDNQGGQDPAGSWPAAGEQQDQGYWNQSGR